MIGNPLFHHYGVAIDIGGENWLVAHHDERGPVITTMDDFLHDIPMKGSVKSALTGKSVDHILDRFERMNKAEFDILTNNCEKWAFKFAKKDYRAKELSTGALYLVLLLIGLKLIKII